MNLLVMQPLGRLAGIGAALVGSFSTLISMLIGRSYNGTILPLVVGMTVLSGITVFIVGWALSK